MQKFTRGHVPRKGNSTKKFIIAYGLYAQIDIKPITKFIKSEFGLEKSVIDINTDSIMRSQTNYAKDIKSCISQFAAKKNTSEVPTQLYTDCAAIYAKYQIETDSIRTNLLQYAVDKHFDILYRIDGSDVHWLVTHELPIANGYDIIIVHSDITDDQLVLHTFSNAQKFGRMLSPDILVKTVQTVERNLLSLFDQLNCDVYIIDVISKNYIFKRIQSQITCDISNLGNLPQIKEYVIRHNEIKGASEYNSLSIGLVIIIILVILVSVYKKYHTFQHFLIYIFSIGKC